MEQRNGDVSSGMDPHFKLLSVALVVPGEAVGRVELASRGRDCEVRRLHREPVASSHRGPRSYQVVVPYHCPHHHIQPRYVGHAARALHKHEHRSSPRRLDRVPSRGLVGLKRGEYGSNPASLVYSRCN